jgi:hypothetical protein
MRPISKNGLLRDYPDYIANYGYNAPENVDPEIYSVTVIMHAISLYFAVMTRFESSGYTLFEGKLRYF